MRSNHPSLPLSDTVREQVDQIQQAVDPDDTHGELLNDWLLPVCAVSPYLQRVATQYPSLVRELLDEGWLQLQAESPDKATLQAELRDRWQRRRDASGSTPDPRQLESLQMAVLRHFRHRQLFRILWQDLVGQADLYRTLSDLSLLADCCIIEAEQWAHEAVARRYGEPLGQDGRPLRLIVLGMGKLGGLELNVSSDIDLICLFAESGQTSGKENGRGATDNGEFFRRVAQGLSRLLNNTTPDGFVYRVDTRLRPFGESGPLVMNLEGLENYYLTQARDWERYAMIKARAITGLADDIRDYEALVTPFVYRRYLDYNAFESLRDLKGKIALSVRQKGLKDNIKLGAGGIREVEFIAQAFQLVRGGRDTRLRSRSLVAVLEQLARQSLIEREEVDALLAAYAYLRRVENAVQMMRDEQVHSLPDDDTDRQRLLVMMDEPDWPAFREALRAHQQQVSGSFAGLFEVEKGHCSEAGDSDTTSSGDSPATQVGRGESTPADTGNSRALIDAWRLISAPEADAQASIARLERFGYQPDEELMAAITAISRGGFYQRLTADSKERVERVVPMIMELALETEQPTETLKRCLALVRAVAGRSGYLQVLADQQSALARLVSLFAESRWLAGFVLRQPMVIDELLIGPGAVLYADSEAVRANALEQLERLRDADLEVQMDSLRHYRQAREMRLACARLDGTLTLMQVSDQLSWLAEAMIEVVLELVEAPLLTRHGRPCCRPEADTDEKPRQTSLGIVAYGKLGGMELGFGSDLDLVFLHDSCGGSQMTDGDKPIDNTMYYAKLAQKFVHFMSTATPAGVLYEIDLRLRPNGSSGVLVTGIEAFSNYQRGDAWTWEHQALMRSRMVLGSESLREQFMQTRSGVLAQPRSDEELREAVASMRERMRVSLGSNRRDSMNLKQDDGGVADIEFIVQYLVLAHSAQYPELLTHTDNIRVLEVVERVGLLAAPVAALLHDAYLELRDRLHRLALQEASTTVPIDDDLRQLRERVIEVKNRILGPVPSAVQ